MQKSLYLRLQPQVSSLNGNSTEQEKAQIKPIQVNSLQFIGSGLQHIVFENKSKQVMEQVIIFTRKKNIQNVLELNKLMVVLDNVYENIMMEMFKDVNRYRWPKQIMYIVDDNKQELEQVYQQLQGQMMKNIKIKDIPNANEFSIDRDNRRVFISKNIFSTNIFNTIVQFKPKSVLPDIYTIQTILKVSSRLSVNTNQIKNIIKSSQPVEKLRWFKKTLSNRNKPNVKYNGNPLNIFNVNNLDHTSLNVDFLQTKTLKYLPLLTSSQQQQLNVCIMSLIQSSGLMRGVHYIQSLCNEPPETIYIENLEKFQLTSVTQQTIIKEVRENINKKLQSSSFTQLNKVYEYLQEFSCVLVEEEKEQKSLKKSICELFFFLLSLTWRDVSVVVRGNFEGSGLVDGEVWIIDDYLKDYGKVRQNIQKNQMLLMKYLKYKLKLEDLT